MIHIHNPACCRIFRNIQVYSRSIQTYSAILWHLKPCVTREYAELCNIQNPGIFRTQHIFRTRSWHILIYLERCLTLAYWEPCHIQNFAVFRILTYLGPETFSESCLFSHIQTYSIVFNNDSININLRFFT